MHRPTFVRVWAFDQIVHFDTICACRPNYKLHSNQSGITAVGFSSKPVSVDGCKDLPASSGIGVDLEDLKATEEIDDDGTLEDVEDGMLEVRISVVIARAIQCTASYFNFPRHPYYLNVPL